MFSYFGPDCEQCRDCLAFKKAKKANEYQCVKYETLWALKRKNKSGSFHMLPSLLVVAKACGGEKLLGHF